MTEIQAQSAYKSLTLRDWITFLTMTVGMFMAILDIQIVSSSLNEIQAGVSASSDEIVWVQTSYLIAEVIMIPLSGFLSRLLSTRVLFTISCLGFTIASFMCALSESLTTLIFFRACQGFLGGAMIPTVFATSFIIFPPEKRTVAAILTGLVATSAPTLGPTVGGYLTDTFSWHWLFLINVIPGAIVTSVIWFSEDFDHPDYSLWKGFDFIGLTLMALFLGSLEYVLEEGPRWQWLEDRSIQFFTVCIFIGAIGFFMRVLLYHQPIVDVRAFKNRNFAFGTFFSFILGIGLYGLVYLLPLYLAVVRQFTALEIGMTMFVSGLFQFIAAPIVGILSQKVDLRLLLFFGFLMFSANAYLCSFITSDYGFREFFWPQVLRGASLMFCFIPINTLALGTIPKEMLKNASGLYNTMRNLGGAIGLALINTVIIQRLALHKTRLSDSIRPGRVAVDKTFSNLEDHFDVSILGDAHTAATQKIYGIMSQQAYALTFGDTFYLIAILFVIPIFFIPLIKKPNLNGDTADVH
ncbi:MAG: DHA2 family efflux MFS transporter permease subunit [Janthinobacterium lividum]